MAEASERKPNEIIKKIDNLIYRLASAKGQDINHIQYQLRELHKQLEEKEK